MNTILQTSGAAIKAVCRRYGVVRLDAFGSILGDGYCPDQSDVDLLVEFGPMEP